MVMGLFNDMTGIGKVKNLSNQTRYVNDYKLVEIPDKKGRFRKKAVYIGTWYLVREWNAETKRQLWGSMVLTVAEAAVYVWMLMLTHLGSGRLLVMLPLLAGIFPVWYMLMGAAVLPYRGKPMRRDQYMHSFIRVSRSTVAVAAFDAVGVAAAFIYRIILNDWMFLAGDWRFLIASFLILILSLLIVIMLRRIDISERENAAFESKPI